MNVDEIDAICNKCDPGIRSTVRLLLLAGFPCTDSGDGVTKPEEARVMYEPHIFLVYRSEEEAAAGIMAAREWMRDNPEAAVDYAQLLEGEEGWEEEGPWVVGLFHSGWLASQ